MFYWKSCAFLMIQWMLAVWSLFPLPFLNPAWISGSSQFTYCWSLDWRILSIPLLVCKISAIVLERCVFVLENVLEYSFPLPFFRIGMATDLFQSCGHCWVFQICWHIECSTFMSISLQPRGLQHAKPPCPSPLPEFTQTHVHGVGEAIQTSHPLSSASPPTLKLPHLRIFSSESVLCIRWPKYWNFSFSISPSNEYIGLISFRIDWLDLLAVQGTLKSLLQHHSSKASILRCSPFFIVQMSHPYMNTKKTIALTRQTFLAMSLLFNMLCRFLTAFFPRSKCLLISWLQWSSAAY